MLKPWAWVLRSAAESVKKFSNRNILVKSFLVPYESLYKVPLIVTPMTVKNSIKKYTIKYALKY